MTLMSRRSFLPRLGVALAATALPTLGQASEKPQDQSLAGVDLKKALSAKVSVFDAKKRSYSISTLAEVLKDKKTVAIFSMGYECPHSDALMKPVIEMGKALPADTAVVVLINAGQVNSNAFIRRYKSLEGITVCADPLMDALKPLSLDRASVFHLLERDKKGELAIKAVESPLEVAGKLQPWRSATRESYVALGELLGGSQLAVKVADTYPQWKDSRRFGCALVPEGSEE